MSQSPSNQTVTTNVTPNTAQAVTSTQYYERIIVTNNSNGDVYVRTDGGVVASTAGNFGAVVLAGAWRMVGNDQPREPNNTPTAGTSPQQEGWTVQNKGFQGATTPNLNPMASGFPTNVSLMATVASASVQLEFV